MRSSTLPGSDASHAMLPYLVLLRMGFTVPSGVGPGRGELLPHPFTLTWRLTPSAVCFLLPAMMRRDEPESNTHHHCPLLPAGLSVTSRCPAVSRHPALRSPDFPPRTKYAATVWTTSRGYYTGHEPELSQRNLQNARRGYYPLRAAPECRHGCTGSQRKPATARAVTRLEIRSPANRRRPGRAGWRNLRAY